MQCAQTLRQLAGRTALPTPNPTQQQKRKPTWGTVSTGLTGVTPSDAFLLVAPETCSRALRGVCLGVPVIDVSQLADPSRTLARDDARTEVERLGLLGTVRRRGVPERGVKHVPSTDGVEALVGSERT